MQVEIEFLRTVSLLLVKYKENKTYLTNIENQYYALINKNKQLFEINDLFRKGYGINQTNNNYNAIVLEEFKSDANPIVALFYKFLLQRKHIDNIVREINILGTHNDILTQENKILHDIAMDYGKSLGMTISNEQEKATVQIINAKLSLTSAEKKYIMDRLNGIDKGFKPSATITSPPIGTGPCDLTLILTLQTEEDKLRNIGDTAKANVMRENKLKCYFKLIKTRLEEVVPNIVSGTGGIAYPDPTLTKYRVDGLNRMNKSEAQMDIHLTGEIAKYKKSNFATNVGGVFTTFAWPANKTGDKDDYDALILAITNMEADIITKRNLEIAANLLAKAQKDYDDAITRIMNKLKAKYETTAGSLGTELAGLIPVFPTSTFAYTLGPITDEAGIKNEIDRLIGKANVESKQLFAGIGTIVDEAVIETGIDAEIKVLIDAMKAERVSAVKAAALALAKVNYDAAIIRVEANLKAKYDTTTGSLGTVLDKLKPVFPHIAFTYTTLGTITDEAGIKTEIDKLIGKANVELKQPFIDATTIANEPKIESDVDAEIKIYIDAMDLARATALGKALKDLDDLVVAQINIMNGIGTPDELDALYRIEISPKQFVVGLNYDLGGVKGIQSDKDVLDKIIDFKTECAKTINNKSQDDPNKCELPAHVGERLATFVSVVAPNRITAAKLMENDPSKAQAVIDALIRAEESKLTGFPNSTILFIKTNQMEDIYYGGLNLKTCIITKATGGTTVKQSIPLCRKQVEDTFKELTENRKLNGDIDTEVLKLNGELDLSLATLRSAYPDFYVEDIGLSYDVFDERGKTEIEIVDTVIPKFKSEIKKKLIGYIQAGDSLSDARTKIDFQINGDFSKIEKHHRDESIRLYSDELKLTCTNELKKIAKYKITATSMPIDDLVKKCVLLIKSDEFKKASQSNGNKYKQTFDTADTQLKSLLGIKQTKHTTQQSDHEKEIDKIYANLNTYYTSKTSSIGGYPNGGSTPDEVAIDNDIKTTILDNLVRDAEKVKPFKGYDYVTHENNQKLQIDAKLLPVLNAHKAKLPRKVKFTMHYIPTGDTVKITSASTDFPPTTDLALIDPANYKWEVKINLKPSATAYTYKFETTSGKSENSTRALSVKTTDPDDIDAIVANDQYWNATGYDLELVNILKGKCDTAIHAWATNNAVDPIGKATELTKIKDDCKKMDSSKVSPIELYIEYRRLEDELNKANPNNAYENEVVKLKGVPKSTITGIASDSDLDAALNVKYAGSGAIRKQTLRVPTNRIIAELKGTRNINAIKDHLSKITTPGLTPYVYFTILFHPNGGQAIVDDFAALLKADAATLTSLNMAGGNRNYENDNNLNYMNDPYYMKYMKYKTRYLVRTGKTDDVIKRMLFRK